MSLHACYPRSKGYLRVALLELLKKKSYDDITVTEIAEKAGYIRQTFYSHYATKESVLQEITSDLANGLVVLMEQVYAEGIDVFFEKLTAKYHPDFVEYFNYMRKHNQVFKILLNPSSGTGFQQRFQEQMISYHERNIHRWKKYQNGDGGKTLETIYYSAANVFITNLFGWVQNGLEPDEQTMAIYHTQLWVSYIMLQKNTELNFFYRLFMEKTKKHVGSAYNNTGKLLKCKNE